MNDQIPGVCLSGRDVLVAYLGPIYQRAARLYRGSNLDALSRSGQVINTKRRIINVDTLFNSPVICTPSAVFPQPFDLALSSSKDLNTNTHNQCNHYIHFNQKKSVLEQRLYSVSSTTRKHQLEKSSHTRLTRVRQLCAKD